MPKESKDEEEEGFEAIVVGAGVAGCACAIKLASEGVSTLLVEQARPVGGKSLSGGVLWGHDLDAILPKWQEEAPIERPVTRKGLHFLASSSDFALSFERPEWGKRPYNAVTVQRAKFDAWLAQKAQEAGATVVDGVPVTGLVKEGGAVVGIRQGEGDGEIVNAKVVVIADGANSRLGIDLGIRGGIPLEATALGIKETILLGKDVIESHFGIGPAQGSASEYVLGHLKDGIRAAGFLYTNKETVSLGVVIDLKSIWEMGVNTNDIIEDFRLHPSIAPLVDGGELVEYGARLLCEGGLDHIPELTGRGFLVVGDAAGFTFNNGFMTQGMNYAIASGIMAAETIARAKKKGSWTMEAMDHYQHLLEESYVMQDMRTFKNTGKFTWNPRMYSKYPQFIEGMFTALFEETGRPKRKLKKILDAAQKDAGISNLTLIRDALGLRHL